MQIHAEDVEESTPRRGSIKDAGVGETDGRIDRAHVGHADFEQQAETRRVRATREDAGDLRKPQSDDHGLPVAQLSRAGCHHDLRGANSRHRYLPAPLLEE